MPRDKRSTEEIVAECHSLLAGARKDIKEQMDECDKVEALFQTIMGDKEYIRGTLEVIDGGKD